MKSLFILLMFLLIPHILLPITTKEYYCTGGWDLTGPDPPDPKIFPCTGLSSSDDLRWREGIVWPDGITYDETKYVLLFFSPDIPSDAAITAVFIVNEYTVDIVAPFTFSKLEVFRDSDNTWNNYSLSVPTTAGVDVIDTIDIITFINTPSDINNIEIKFLSYTNTEGISGDYKSLHDFLQIIVITTDSTYYFIPTGGDDHTSGTSVLFPETCVGISDDIKYQSWGNWPDEQTGYNEAKFIEFHFSPDVPSDKIVTSVKIVNEYAVTKVIDETSSKLEVYEYTSGNWVDYTLSVPTVAETDVTDTIDVSLLIDNPSDVNNIKIRFLSYTARKGKYKTKHDQLKLVVTYMDNPTAIELSQFYAVTFIGKIVLHWRAESETNNNEWRIMKSASNPENYRLLAILSGKGTVSSPSDYKYVDMDVKVGMYFYRLEAVDVNGSIKWYGPIQVYYGKELSCQYFDIFPSLSSSSFNIKISIPYKSKWSLKIYDISGKHVKTLVDEVHDAGVYRFKWDGKNNRGKRVSSGTYFVKFKAENYNSLKKVILIQ
ncbi:MAG: T9SS type A sorting domain-containing protein [Candidatus Cloacimonadota bacterium]|nr:MAG: T9SS type A sorting domain-containing protein [Candidatus Cloacimonadota bacterium]